MILEGKSLIGQQAITGTSAAIHAVNPATGEPLDPAYAGGSAAEVEKAAQLAWDAFDTYRETSLEDRAMFLETVASEIEA
ncbi:aldehyde dehydrogenase family protein, partial [Halomonas sp. WWR20]